MKIKPFLRKSYHHLRNYKFHKVFFSAGMPRSGSTLLFNIIQELLLIKYSHKKISSGWVEDMPGFPKGDIYLVKTHHLDQIDIFRAYRTFYSFRDVRDVLVSRLRKFDKEPTIEIVRYYIRQYQFAMKHADLILKYEEMIKNLDETIKKIADILKVDVRVDEIIARLPKPTTVNPEKGKHAKSTMLYKDHITGTQQGEWKDILSPELGGLIMQEFDWWFKENNYK